MSISHDYRNTDSCPSLKEISIRKNEIEQKIREKHKRIKIIYNKVSDKSSDYFEEFSYIYHHKCAYCGASRKFTDIRLFEIDHYICESAFPKNTAGRAEAGKIENLVFSCYSCNRGKAGLHIKDKYLSILNPDDNSIASVFYRDDAFYIKLNSAYVEDDFIQQFYDQLLLGSEFRRLDFLLLEMYNLIRKLQENNSAMADRLGHCMCKLMQKKNNTFI